MFWDSSNYSSHNNLCEYVCTIETGCKSGVDHISSIILNSTSNKKVQTEKIETGCKSGLDDDSCGGNNQIEQAVILSDLVIFMIFDDYLTLRQVVLILIALSRFLFWKMSTGKFNLHVSFSLGSFVSDKNI